MKLNIQFFAEEDVTNLNPLEAIQKIMSSMENMEDFTEEFDIIKFAISNQVTAKEESEPDYSDYVPKEKYDNLKSAYVKRFGEMTEQHIEVSMEQPHEGEKVYNIDFTRNMFDGSTE